MAMAGVQTFKAIVSISADGKGALRELQSVDRQIAQTDLGAARQLSKAEAAMTRVKGAAAVMGAAVVLQVGKYSVDAARDLEEAINAVNVMYGDSADAVVAMSETAADRMGLSKRKFDEAAVAVGGFIEQISAVSGKSMEEELRTLMERAGDFGSVFNIDVDEALQRFRSGLAGETEPLRKFGINLLDSEIKAKALRMGLINVGDTMTEGEKVFARYQLLLEKTEKTAGDFAATSGNLANQQRILRADIENMAARFGETLVPAVQLGIDAIGLFIGTLEAIKVPEVLQQIADLFAGLKTSMPELDQVEIKVGVAGVQRTTDNLNALATAQQKVVSSKGAFDSLEGIWRVASQEDGQRVEAWRNTLEALQGIAAVNPEGFEAIVDDVRRFYTHLDSGNPALVEFAESMGLSTLAAEDFEVAMRAIEKTPLPELTLETIGFDEMPDTGWISEAKQQTIDYYDSLMLLDSGYDHLGSSVGKMIKIDEQAARMAEIHAEAVKQLFEEIEDALDDTFDYEKAVLGASESVRDAAASQIEYNETVAQYGETSVEAQTALDELTGSQIEAVESLYELAEARAKEAGIVEGTNGHYSFMLGELRDMKDEYPELEALINEYIKTLLRIPDSITTTLHVVGQQYTVGGDLIGDFARVGEAPRRAHGGPVAAGRPYLVGEEGPELMVPSLSGTIVPNNQLGSSKMSQLDTDVLAATVASAVERGMRNGYRAMQLAERAA